MKNWKNMALVASVCIVLLIPLSLLKETKRRTPQDQGAVFSGSKSCKECHSNEYASWQKSHHFHAMSIASDSTVLGDFNNATVNEGSNTHRFFKRDGRFFVNTLGPNGKLADFEITHTFGYKPLQQYLIPFDDGKLQCFHIAWNSEEEKWFNLSSMVYGKDISLDNWLHWTKGGQTWNGMCAECHSTHLQKNYNADKESYNTSYAEINVGCEACHGPGSEHIKWAQCPEGSHPPEANHGLLVKTGDTHNKEFVDRCARCHSRRGQVSDFSHEWGNNFDFMLVGNLDEHYCSDGQVSDEDYVYGSFVQSKMYHNGVACNHCHNVHSGERLMEGNSLCYQCHNADYYGTKRHHFHKLEGEQGKPLVVDGKLINVGEGSKCVACHMPGKFYMAIDNRNDHSIRIPRPDLSKELGTPNACNSCHSDKSMEWAEKYCTLWYGIKRKPHYGEIFAKAKLGNPIAELPLTKLAKDTLYPKIVRASALDYLANYHSDTAFQTLRFFLDDPAPILRYAAIKAFTSPSPHDLIAALCPLLSDPHRVIRSQVAFKLSELPEELIPVKCRDSFKKALSEFKKNNLYMADFPTGRMNLGLMYANTGELEEAMENYQKAIDIDPDFIPAKVNLAKLYYFLGENHKSEQLYRHILKKHPEFSEAYYSLGLLLAEEMRYSESTVLLEQAGIMMPKNGRVFYNLALVYQKVNNLALAEKNLQKALGLEPDSFDFLYALCHFYISQGKIAEAKQVVPSLVDLYPDDEGAKQLMKYLND